MNDQQELWTSDRQEPSGEAYARRTDPDTSHDAAESIEGTPATRMEKQVLEALRSKSAGCTNHELVELTGLSWSSVSPRLKPLVTKGLVVDSGTRRPGPSGRGCIVWIAIR